MTEGHHLRLGLRKRAASIWTLLRQILLAAGNIPRLCGFALGALLLGCVAVFGQETVIADKWDIEIAPYAVVPWVSGNLTAKGQTVDFSRGAASIVDDLRGGFMAHTLVGYGHWYAGTDIFWAKLSASNRAVDSDLTQLFVEPRLGYRIVDWLEVFAGARYNNVDTTLNFNGPLQRQVSDNENWWDPIVGTRAVLPLSECWFLSARFDVGGFGANSDWTINAEPLVNWRFSDWGSAQLGWRFFWVDFKNPSRQFKWDLLTQGPEIGVTFYF